MTKEVVSCDRCKREIKNQVHVKIHCIAPAGARLSSFALDFCVDCQDDLKRFMNDIPPRG